MRENFLTALGRGRLLFDGGMGALLAEMGYDTEKLDVLNVEAPEAIRGVHRRYVEAGAQVIITCSLGTNPIRLARSGLADRCAELIAASVDNARAAAQGRAFVALDMGPTGDFLAPAGSLSFEQMFDAFSLCARAGAEAGADLILLETQTDIAECRAACIAAKRTGLPVAASLTFGANGRTLTGGTPACAALVMEAAGASVAGVNCGCGPVEMLGALKAMRPVTRLPILVQPNAGLPETLPGGTVRYPYTPEKMAAPMRGILDAGAAAIGGCCGTTPDHIRLFADLTRDMPAAQSAWGGLERIASARKVVSLAKARAHICEVMEIDDLFELEPDDVPLIPLGGLSPDEARDTVVEAQSVCAAPLAFEGDGEALEAALRVYAGVAAVLDGSAEIIRRYGAKAL